MAAASAGAGPPNSGGSWEVGGAGVAASASLVEAFGGAMFAGCYGAASSAACCFLLASSSCCLAPLFLS